MNHHVALTIHPPRDKVQFSGQVEYGSNEMTLNLQRLNLRGDGSAYADLNLRLNVDFRLSAILHEIGHIVDGLWLWDGSTKNEIMMGFPTLTNTSPSDQIFRSAHAAVWPNKWWDAYRGLKGFPDGMYEESVREKFAEMFAQYILQPQGLKAAAPLAYDFPKTKIFANVEFRGYENCPDSIRELTASEKAQSPNLAPSCLNVSEILNCQSVEN